MAHGERDLSWYAALDLCWNADQEWQTGASGQAGLLLQSEQSRSLRLGAAAYTGPAMAGKRAGEDDSWLGGVLALDWHGGGL